MAGDSNGPVRTGVSCLIPKVSSKNGVRGALPVVIREMTHTTNGAELMPRGNDRAVTHHLHRLFTHGSVAGLSSEQLLERFLSRRDESAFAALVARHGPMVLGVCRRHLSDSHDVEDAFQATFLVLVRKAASLRERQLLDHWLYAVAYRIAVRARARGNRIRSRELIDVELEAEDGVAWSELGDLKEVIDREVSRLPLKFRAPVVLCYFEGRSNEEAANQLGCPVGTIRSRLARARERLRTRLSRLGFGPSPALLEAVLSPAEASAFVSRSLLESTVLHASAFATRNASAYAAVPCSVLTLSEGVLSTMFLTKLKLSAAGVLLFGVLAAGALGQSPKGAPSETSAAEADRLKEVEIKLDRLLQVIEPGNALRYTQRIPTTMPGPATAAPAASPETRPNPATTRHDQPARAATGALDPNYSSNPNSRTPAGMSPSTGIIAGQPGLPGATEWPAAAFRNRNPSDSERLASIERRLARLESKLDQVHVLLSEDRAERSEPVERVK